jgi:hypothetical protein
MPTAGELWAEVQAAEKEHQAVIDELDAFGVLDPSSEWTPEYGDAYDAEHAAWVKAEGARHELDAFPNPRRYAGKGYQAEALDQFRAQAATEAEPEA